MIHLILYFQTWRLFFQYIGSLSGFRDINFLFQVAAVLFEAFDTILQRPSVLALGQPVHI